jgi:hypothetical protein
MNMLESNQSGTLPGRLLEGVPSSPCRKWKMNETFRRMARGISGLFQLIV